MVNAVAAAMTRTSAMPERIGKPQLVDPFPALDSLGGCPSRGDQLLELELARSSLLVSGSLDGSAMNSAADTRCRLCCAKGE